MFIDVDYNEQWFLNVPDPRPDSRGAESEQWARAAVDQFNIVQDWADPEFREALVATVLEQSMLFTTDATAGFLYCPRGLPATAVVEIALGSAEGSGALAALDALPDDETALPRQVTDVTAKHLGDGVLVHGVAAEEDQVFLGIASYSFVVDSMHVLVTITSPDLNAIALGRDHFDELVDAIVVRG